MDKNNKRPRYLNLLKISMPVTAVVSIAHRVSGALLVVAIPFLMYALQMSVSSVQQYAKLTQAMQYPLVKGIIVLLLWSFLHHFFAGIRFLLIDIDAGVSRTAARFSAWMVHGLALGLTVLVAAGVLL
ncbi:MAG: succinate dehydrogenase, cytochrome b556 subunit [Gammaproteobacteria bacterium]|jgi:succinate dehydrogenase / fumarate reductase cytochrome b subunit